METLIHFPVRLHCGINLNRSLRECKICHRKRVDPHVSERSRSMLHTALPRLPVVNVRFDIKRRVYGQRLSDPALFYPIPGFYYRREASCPHSLHHKDLFLLCFFEHFIQLTLIIYHWLFTQHRDSSVERRHDICIMAVIRSSYVHNIDLFLFQHTLKVCIHLIAAIFLGKCPSTYYTS